MDIKVGQVWKHVHTQRCWRVIFVGKYEATIADEEGSFSEALWKFEKGIFTLESSPAELSDLEIVQKALEYQGAHMFVDEDGELCCEDVLGNILVAGDTVQVLTWAKQQIGGE